MTVLLGGEVVDGLDGGVERWASAAERASSFLFCYAKNRPPLRSSISELRSGGSGWSKLRRPYCLCIGVLALRIETISCAAGGTATSRVSTSSLAGILEP